jgi:hypothetical protein
MASNDMTTPAELSAELEILAEYYAQIHGLGDETRDWFSYPEAARAHLWEPEHDIKKQLIRGLENVDDPESQIYFCLLEAQYQRDLENTDTGQLQHLTRLSDYF